MANRLFLLLAAAFLLLPVLSAQSFAEEDQTAKFAEALDSAIFANADARIAAALEDILKAIEGNPEDYGLRIAAARGYLARADLLRADRHTGRVPREKEESFRERQAEWGKAGAEHAGAAKKLASSDSEKSEAYRLSGECTVHRINGPIAGMRFGPRAKSDIEFALSKDPTNWEAHRALGLMYLNNPPINGGDTDKAIETFTNCAEKEGDRDVYHALLAQAWMKKDRPERARLEVAKALQKNPDNRLALDLREMMQEENQW